MSRHGPNPEIFPDVYNYPISEQLLARSHPMSHQRSNDSYGSGFSSSYGSTAGSHLSASPIFYDTFDTSNSAHNQVRHNSQGSVYGNAQCISPLDLEAPPNYFDNRHGHGITRHVLHSSNTKYTEQYDEAIIKALPHRPVSGRRHDRRSSSVEKEPPLRVPCEWPGCCATFSRKADVNRHLTSTHDVKLMDCDVHRCERVGENGFARKDHLLEHKRGYHCQDIPKRNIKNSKSRHDRS